MSVERKSDGEYYQIYIKNIYSIKLFKSGKAMVRGITDLLIYHILVKPTSFIRS
jgi:hypothetical protein